MYLSRDEIENIFHFCTLINHAYQVLRETTKGRIILLPAKKTVQSSAA